MSGCNWLDIDAETRAEAVKWWAESLWLYCKTRRLGIGEHAMLGMCVDNGQRRGFSLPNVAEASYVPGDWSTMSLDRT